MRQRDFMKRRRMAIAVLMAVVFVGPGAASICAQEKAATAAALALEYDVGCEVTLTGQVVAYPASSKVPPLGPHVTLQTSAGVMDVHLGDGRLLEANHMDIASGDTLRIIGESVTMGSSKQFVARIVQKGTQVVVVRSASGFPLSPAAVKTKGGQQ